jgi:hypothetical protein
MSSPVLPKVFKSKDVEQSNGLSIVCGVWIGFIDGSVNLIYDPNEHTTIDTWWKTELCILINTL